MTVVETGILAGSRTGLQCDGMIPGRGEPFSALQAALEGRYRLYREIGRGKFGIVYLAREEELEREVALKLLTPNAADPGLRLFREAKIAAGLSHPNVVSIFAAAQAGEFAFFTMQYVEGETLSQRMEAAGGRLSVAQATEILRDVAAGVGFLHTRGVIHRDLKPDNIVLDRANASRPMIMDFGIARVEQQPDFIKAGYVAGSPAFMAPEVVCGAAGDERSDVYALGILGYYLVHGKAPFDGKTPEAVREQQVRQPAPTMMVPGPHGDLTFSEAMNRCMDKDPARRFRSGSELAEALSQAPELRPEMALPLRLFANDMRRVERTVSPLFGIGLVVLVALARALLVGDWTPSAMVAGAIALVLLCGVAYMVPATRRALKAGFGQEKIAAAWKEHMKREQVGMAFESSSWPVLLSRISFALGGALFVVGAGLGRMKWLVAPDEAQTIGTVGLIILVATALKRGFFSARKGDRAGRWWLSFWEGWGGRQMVRLAGIGGRGSVAGGGSSTAEVPSAIARVGEIGPIGKELAEEWAAFAKDHPEAAQRLKEPAPDEGQTGSEVARRQERLVERLKKSVDEAGGEHRKGLP